MQNTAPSAAIIIIGNEILSGRTQDKNVSFIATQLSDLGILLHEVRIIADIAETIGQVAREFSEKYDYVFTSGGIGPTHDDITAQSLADAFSIKVERNQEAFKLLNDYYQSKGRVLNVASSKMADIPEGCPLISNSVSAAPGFIVNNNIFVFAGVPNILQAMFKAIIPQLKTSQPFISKTLSLAVGESAIAQQLESVQNQYPLVIIGSYPGLTEEGHHMTSIVLRSNNHNDLHQSFTELDGLLQQFDRLV